MIGKHNRITIHVRLSQLFQKDKIVVIIKIVIVVVK